MMSEKEDDTDLDSLDEKYEKLLMQRKQEQLDINKLNGTRNSPKDSKKIVDTYDSIKLASLEVNEDLLTMESHEVLKYFSLLGAPDNKDDVDFMQLENLLSTADINFKDKHGQTIMHEVAREWSTDVALYLNFRGANIDEGDAWGRTPLFVAVASNHVEMVSWLIKNGVKLESTFFLRKILNWPIQIILQQMDSYHGVLNYRPCQRAADINHRTLGEKQTPIHFAARYDTIEAFDLLLKLGACPTEKDAHGREPFFLAAQNGNERICALMLTMDLPTACYAVNGEATIDHIVENLRVELAEKALDQYYSLNKSTGDAKLYLGCLCKRRSVLLCSNKQLQRTMPPNPLEIITRRGILELAKHPVMVKLIKLKYEKVGKKLIRLNIILHFIFTFLWTFSVAIRVPLPDEMDVESFHIKHSVEMKAILGLTLAAQPVFLLFIRKLIGEFTSLVQLTNDEKKRLLDQYKFYTRFVHPRWPKDNCELRKTKQKAKNMYTDFWYNGWSIIEALCLLMTCIQTVITIYWYFDTKNIRVLTEVRMYHSTMFVIVIWTRLNRAFRSDRMLGPFVVMLAQSSLCLFRITFLFFEFFIPFSVFCWVIFGGDQIHKGSKGGAVSSNYQYIHNLLYQLFLLSIGGDYDFASLKAIDSLTAQLFIGLYFLLLTVITLNIYTASLSEMAQRIIATANERADLEESDSCGKVERTYPQTKHVFEKYLVEHCSPLEVKWSTLFIKPVINVRTVVINSSIALNKVKRIVNDIVEEQKLAKKDLRIVEEKMMKVKEKWRNQEEVTSILKKVKKIMDTQSVPVINTGKKISDRLSKYINRVKDEIEKK